MSARAAAVLAALALLASVTGGGGRASASALSFEGLALGAVVVAFFATRRLLVSPLAAAGALFCTAVALSAALAVETVSAGSQAAAWLAAFGIGWSLVAALDAERERVGETEARRARQVGALAVTAAFLAVELAGILGHPLLGRAGASAGPRPLGTFMDPNHLTLLLLVGAAIHARWAGTAGLARIHLAAAGACATLALATASRIAPLALVGLGVGEVLRRRIAPAVLRSRRVQAAVAGVAAVGLVATAWTLHLRLGEADQWTRLRIWRAALPATLDRPLLGLGPAGFQHAWWPYDFPLHRGIGWFEAAVTTPHGEWLRVPIELGFVGAALLAVFLGLVVARLRDRREILPLAGTLAPTLLVHDVFHSSAASAWVAAAVSLLLLDAGRAPTVHAAESRPARGEKGWAVAVLLAAAAALAWRLRVTQGDVLLDDGLARRDAAALEAAVELSPRDANVLVSVAGVVAPEGRPLTPRELGADALLEEASRLARRDPGPVLARARLAARAMHDIFPEVATRMRVEELYAEAGRRAPKDAFLRESAAAACLAASDPAAALGFASEAIALEPDMRRALALRVLALEDLGRTSEAAAAREAFAAHLARTSGPEPRSPYERDLLECEPLFCDRVAAEP